jgi:Reverse transcriptase (RNA-dependent DNA polymerase)
MLKMCYSQSKANLCLFFKQNKKNELSIWISWVDDLLTVGKDQVAQVAKEEMKKHFDCDDIGKLEEFLGNKIEIDFERKTARFMQPVLLQSLKDEFVLKKSKTMLPATAGKILSYKNKGVVYLNITK